MRGLPLSAIPSSVPLRSSTSWTFPTSADEITPIGASFPTTTPENGAAALSSATAAAPAACAARTPTTSDPAHQMTRQRCYFQVFRLWKEDMIWCACLTNDGHAGDIQGPYYGTHLEAIVEFAADNGGRNQDRLRRLHR